MFRALAPKLNAALATSSLAMFFVRKPRSSHRMCTAVTHSPLPLSSSTLTPARHRRRASTFSNQPVLPRLPVPKLLDTVQRYEQTLEPFLESYAQQLGITIEQLKIDRQRIVHDFVKPNGLGRKLQERLIGRITFLHLRKFPQFHSERVDLHRLGSHLSQ